MKGKYIVFEGVVGSGKSTHSKKLVDRIKEKFPDRDVIWTREPGGTEIAESIRELVQGTEFRESMDPVCEAYLYASARAQLLRKKVRPILKKDGIVVSDRSFVTSMAYQAGPRGLEPKVVEKINKTAIDGMFPDLVIFLDVDPSVGLSRTSDQAGDKFEREDVDFFRHIRKRYKEISRMKEFEDTWIEIKVEGSVDEVFEKVKNKVFDFIS